MKLTVEPKGDGVAMTPLLLTVDGVGAPAAFLMMLFIGGCLIGVVFYSLPSLIVGEGGQTCGVLLVNLFFGWAVLGWLGCLIWAIWYLVGQQGDELIVPWPKRGRVLRGQYSCIGERATGANSNGFGSRKVPFLSSPRRGASRENPPGVNL
jgi:hypothetical protein